MSLPHNLRLRPDLVIELQDPASGTWVVKDPVSLRFFLFGGDERFILNRLDGRRTLDQIVEDFARERAPKRMTTERLHAFLAALHRNGLASSDAPRQGQIMLQRADEQQRRENVLGWSNLLAIRLPGFNPDALLDRIYDWFRWCFTWWFLACAAVLSAFALGVVITDWDSLWLAWPHLHEFVSGRNLVWLGTALVFTKCLHELAHGLTCKHFGGRCHEAGVILLVFMPCLYCNVTDAWMLRSRWQRIAISAAGMIVELLLASTAVLLWRYTQAGVLNAVALHVIVVCGVSTLLFNGNPLLKHDGYYILSDVLRMPNLWQESRGYLYGKLGSWLRADSRHEETPPNNPGLLIAYATSSTIYRICLTIGILLFLYRALHPRGMDLVVLMIAASIALQTAIVWSTPIARWWRDPTKWKRLNKWAPVAVGLVVVGLLGVVCLIPFPASVTAPALLQPRDAVKVFVTSPGLVSQSVAIGDWVEKGQTLAVLDNAKLTDDRLIAASELARSQARVRTLQFRLNDEEDAAAKLAVAQEIATDLTEQARLRENEFNRLRITAPLTGIVLPPPPVAAKPTKKELPTWTGSPLEPENRGCYLERGTLLCLIGQPDNCDAVAMIDETDLPYVKVGQSVRLQMEHSPVTILAGTVAEIAELNAETAPTELAAQHDVAVHDSPSGEPKPIRTMYQARIKIDSAEAPLLIGSRGTVRIKIAPQTIATKFTRWALDTFSAEPKL